MKATDKDKSIHTIPEGTWEAGIINSRKQTSKKQHLNTITTDSQSNGYPILQENQDE